MALADPPVQPDFSSTDRLKTFFGWLPHLLLLGVLALAIVWAWQDTVPGLIGHYNDDATYVCFARALARGRGYIIPWSFQPIFSERFPIGFPLLLAALYKLTPGSLEHHIFAMQIAVNLLAAAFLACSYLFMVRCLRLSPWAALAGVGLVALNPFYPDLASTTMSDLPFGLFFVAAWWLHVRYMERQSLGRLLPAAFAVTVAILVRYAAAILPAVTVIMLWRLGRRKVAMTYSLVLALMLAPWGGWVLAHRLFGYASQYAHTTATPGIFAASILFSGLFLAYLGLATFLFPQVFLHRFPRPSPIAFQNPAYLGLGLLAVALFFLGLYLTFRQSTARSEPHMEARRFAVITILSYLALLWIWVAGFLNLEEFLTVRLLLPIVPTLIALTLQAWVTAARGWRPGPQAIGALTLAGLLLLGGVGGWRLHVDMAPGQAKRQANLAMLVALMKNFVGQVPRSMRVATSMEPIFHLYTGRRCYGASPNPTLMLSELVDLPIRFLFLSPVLINRRDLSMELIHALDAQRPGLATSVPWNGGGPTGVFRIDRSKLAG